MNHIFSKIKSGNAGYAEFQDLVSSYRYSQILFSLFDSDLINQINPKGSTSKELCTQVGWDDAYGKRFLNCLCELGILTKEDDSYYQSEFVRKFMSGNSAYNQNPVFPFEKRLVESWKGLDKLLVSGKRIYSTENKDQTDYLNDLDEYLKAMNAAAVFRSDELWNAIRLDNTGVLMDVGAGSGAFLTGFLNRYPDWRGVFCDLTDVVDRFMATAEYEDYQGRLNLISCNLLESEPFPEGVMTEKADVVLVSNLIHCQGPDETTSILKYICRYLKKEGVLLIHDFFSDSSRGALYDIHMMLNTYNGRTYNQVELKEMLSECGLLSVLRMNLPSGTSLFCAARQDRFLPGRTTGETRV